MKITNEIRAIEAHVKSISTDKSKQIAILNEAQRMARGGSDYNMTILIVAKNRIRKA